MKILVVDDMERNVYQLQVLLGARGYTVESAVNGAVALEMARQTPPDLIITDILMPVMDGFALCREWMLDERLKRIPLIFYTATYIDEHDRDFGLSLGAARFIVKPEEPDAFLQTIKDVIADYARGNLPPPRTPLPPEAVFLKGYNEALIRKLEEKNRDLEQANRQLALDLAERQRVGQQLREQNEILSNSHEGVMIVNLANAVSFWNHGAEEIFGWTAAEALGRSPMQLMGIGDRRALSAMLAAVERDGHWHGELRVQSRDGRKLIVESRVTLVRDDAGRPRARLNFLADITEKKTLETKFLRAQRMESLGLLAAGIAHDLNNILAPILMGAPMLREHASSDLDTRILNNLEKSAQRGAALVRQILAFAHGLGGERSVIQAKHLIADIGGMISETFPKSIRFETEIAAELWTVNANPTHIHQVLLNLCVNARDAMPEGGTLRLSAQNRVLDARGVGALGGIHPGAYVVLCVEDTGVGIPPEVLPHIWDPFFTTKEAGQGTGLGLSTVRGIVQNQNGFIDVRTAPGQGTTFSVYLPADDEAIAQICEVPPALAPRGNGELILIVDDEAVIRDTTTAALAAFGYRVLAAIDGVEAMTLLVPRLPEIRVVVTDIDMPNLDGIALARTLRRLSPAVKIIVASGVASGRSLPAETEGLADGFLLKPFNVEALLTQVHVLLQSSKPSDPLVQPSS
jgi:two-component system, cell cycle sensor histidine kinase and response regulator CckA